MLMLLVFSARGQNGPNGNCAINPRLLPGFGKRAATCPELVRGLQRQTARHIVYLCCHETHLARSHRARVCRDPRTGSAEDTGG